MELDHDFNVAGRYAAHIDELLAHAGIGTPSILRLAHSIAPSAKMARIGIGTRLSSSSGKYERF